MKKNKQKPNPLEELTPNMKNPILMRFAAFLKHATTPWHSHYVYSTSHSVFLITYCIRNNTA